MSHIKQSALAIGITVFMTACASMHQGAETASQLVTQLRQIVDETKALNEELSQRIDAWEAYGRSVDTLFKSIHNGRM